MLPTWFASRFFAAFFAEESAYSFPFHSHIIWFYSCVSRGGSPLRLTRAAEQYIVTIEYD